ncbi:hypothetical protein [Enterococcus sp. BWR-S5]|uniref:hypothetical protein n=1 Tax=Enterococcus sp. BWR-S5 TaxID=2787714 RepID=UPI0019230B5B|nr:hypothetical protein [Enterococcus sp. BWR-S5]MBL1227249.1 hypothetical protein [Enterococcus sp. BWR-S5]
MILETGAAGERFLPLFWPEESELCSDGPVLDLIQSFCEKGPVLTGEGTEPPKQSDWEKERLPQSLGTWQSKEKAFRSDQGPTGPLRRNVFLSLQLEKLSKLDSFILLLSFFFMQRNVIFI